METLTVSEEKDNPVFDEQALDKLLEAAFVLQEHNRGLRELDLRLQLKRDQVEAEDRASSPKAPAPLPPSPASGTQPDYTLTLGKIVEAQHHIQVRKLGLNDAMSLVAERVVEIAAASGAAVAIANGQTVRYPAIAGIKTLPAGTVVPKAKALCSACMNAAQVVRVADVSSGIEIEIEECRHRGIQSLILAPIFHEGEIAGALEVYYATPHAFTDQDVHTSQLMAGLITEALVRDEEATWKKSLAEERAAMLGALEKLQPNLAALVEKPAAKSEAPTPTATPAGKLYICHKCGHPLLENEQFCGECGSPRNRDYEAPSMQSKVASLWHPHEVEKEDGGASAASAALRDENSAAEGDRVRPQHSQFDEASLQALEEIIAPVTFGSDKVETAKDARKAAAGVLEHETPADKKEDSGHDEDQTIEQEEATVEEESAAETALSKPTIPADWSSAASARNFLEQLSSGNRRRSIAQFWNARRGDVYLAIALILVACVIRWGVWPSHATNPGGVPNTTAAAQKKAGPDADVSFFDRMLIRLGLADAPEPPEDRGNPLVQVWVDQRTALYYCPGADLYGKTPKGKFTTQRDAQLDQFEPAYRKTCN